MDEADIGSIQSGQKAYFTVSAYPDKCFPATLTKVAYGATTTENVVTYTTYLNVDNADLLLRPGMTASATVTTAERSKRAARAEFSVAFYATHFCRTGFFWKRGHHVYAKRTA